MQQPDDAELVRLRQGLTDLVALPATPAMWTGSRPPALLAELADALVGSFQLDFAFVQLSRPDGTGAAEAVRGSGWTSVREWL